MEGRQEGPCRGRVRGHGSTGPHRGGHPWKFQPSNHSLQGQPLPDKCVTLSQAAMGALHWP